MLGNDSVKTFPREPMSAIIGRLLLVNRSVKKPKTIGDSRRKVFSVESATRVYD
jgi:hypothetical protein